MAETDPAAWTEYPEYQWVFNKLLLTQKQDIPCGPIGVDPPADLYPLVVKPIYNLWGGGIDAYVIETQFQALRNTPTLDAFDPGCFWMPYLEGDHVSTDIAPDSNAVSAFKAHPCFGFQGPRLGVFDYWERLAMAEIGTLTPMWVPEIRGAAINIESIGDKIIEIHLRPGDESSGFRYILPIWGQPGKHYTLKQLSWASFDGACQAREDPFGDVCPPDAQRVGVILANDLEEGRGERRKLISLLDPKIPEHLQCILS